MLKKRREKGEKKRPKEGRTLLKYFISKDVVPPKRVKYILLPTANKHLVDKLKMGHRQQPLAVDKSDISDSEEEVVHQQLSKEKMTQHKRMPKGIAHELQCRDKDRKNEPSCKLSSATHKRSLKDQLQVQRRRSQAMTMSDIMSSDEEPTDCTLYMNEKWTDIRLNDWRVNTVQKHACFCRHNKDRNMTGSIL